MTDFSFCLFTSDFPVEHLCYFAFYLKLPGNAASFTVCNIAYRKPGGWVRKFYGELKMMIIKNEH